MTHTVNSTTLFGHDDSLVPDRRQTGRTDWLATPLVAGWPISRALPSPATANRGWQDDSRLSGRRVRVGPKRAAQWFRYIHRPSGVLCIAGCDSGWCCRWYCLQPHCRCPFLCKYVAPRGYTDVAPSSTCDGWSGRRVHGRDPAARNGIRTQRNRHGLIRSAEIYRSRPAMGLSHGRMQETAVGVDYCDKEA